MKEATKSFQECVDIVPLVTSNPLNIFSAKRNLVINLAEYDLNEANNLIETIYDDYEPEKASWDFILISGNVFFYAGFVF